MNLLKQETSVILKIVGKQRRILTSITVDSHRTNPLLERSALNYEAPSPWSSAPKKRAIDHDDYYAVPAASYVPHRAYSEAPPRLLARAHDAHDPYAVTVRDEFTKPPQEYYRISPTTPGGFRELLVGDCLSLIERRYAAFQELWPYVEYLQQYVCHLLLTFFLDLYRLLTMYVKRTRTNTPTPKTDKNKPSTPSPL